MKVSTPLLLLLLPVGAHSDDAFTARVGRASALEATPAGQAYQDVMWPKVQPFVASLMQRCVPDDPKADLRSFVFVATISAEAQPQGIEVRPLTEVSKCFAAGMTGAPFPKPPPDFAAEGLLITLHMRLHEMN